MPLPYKIMLGFVICAPVVGCFIGVVLPLTFQKIKEDHAAEAIAEVERMVESVQALYEESCELPSALPRLSDLSTCCGTERCEPSQEAVESWRSAGVHLPEEALVFTFETVVRDGDYLVRGISDFRCDPAYNHTYEVRLTPIEEGGQCVLVASPGVTRNEFY